MHGNDKTMNLKQNKYAGNFVTSAKDDMSTNADKLYTHTVSMFLASYS